MLRPCARGVRGRPQVRVGTEPLSGARSLRGKLYLLKSLVCI